MVRGSRKPPILFGVVCSGTTFPAWQAECLRRLMSLDYVEPDLLISIREMPPAQRSKGLKNFLWRLVVFFERFFLPAKRLVDMGPELVGVKTMHCEMAEEKPSAWFFGAGDLAAIKERGLDVILCFGSDTIGGEILGVPRYGFWTFQHGEELKGNRETVGFWEICNGSHTTAAFLHKKTADHPSGNIVLKGGYLKTRITSYYRNCSQIYLESSNWPAQVCADIANDCAPYTGSSLSVGRAAAGPLPTNIQVLTFFLKLARNIVLRAFEFFFFYDVWNIGVIDNSIDSLLGSSLLPHVTWLPDPPAGSYVADPFPISHGGADYVFFEDYHYLDRGRIGVVSIDGSGRNSASMQVMAQGCHMSYPYVFEKDGRIYCVPEAGESGEVSLYEATEFPGRWQKVKTLIDGFAGTDSTLFLHEGRWWLWATDRNDGPDHKLRLWYADDLFGPWKQHGVNPVKIDVRSSRPAGTPFIHEGELLRPAQDCSRTYGGRIVVNRVLLLTPDRYEEEVAGVLEPDPNWPYPDGLHTVARFRDRTVIDGKRRTPVYKCPRVLLYKWRLLLPSRRQV